MQKLFFCLVIFLVAGVAVQAQSPYRRIDSLYLMTPNPCPGDSVSVIGEFVCNTGGISDMGSGVVQGGNTFFANETVCQGLLQVITYFKDTFHLGVLPQGSYTFKCDYYTADASFYCQFTTFWDSAGFAFTVGPPTAQIANGGPNSTVTTCQNDSVLLLANTGPNITYQWLLNNAAIPGATDSTYWASQPGDYQVIVNRCNFPDTSGIVTLVVSIPAVNLNLPGNACDNDPGYPLTGGSPPGGYWSGPFVSGSNFDSFTAPVGWHVVTYTYIDSVNCSGNASDSLYVAPSPQVSLSAYPAVCETDPPFALSGGQPSGGVYTGAGVNNGIFDPAAAGPGTHLISYTWFNANQCSGTATQPLAVNPAPATPTITVVGDTLFSSAPNGNQWYNLAGPIPGATGNYYIPPVSGNYYVVTTDGFGCGSRPSNPVDFTVAVGIADQLASQWEVQWFSDAGSIQISGLADSYLELSLHDLQGKVLLHHAGRTDANGALRIETSAVANGMYLLRLATEDGTMAKRLLVW